MVEIIEILSRCDEQMGVLQPFICRGSDGNLYYVKGSNCTPREQIAEWLAANLAHRFGLPTPQCDIASIDSELAELTSPAWKKDLKLEHCFASRSVDPCESLTLSMARRIEQALKTDVLMFDYWIKNSDRNLSEKGGNVNILTDPTGTLIQVIDFNLAFDKSFTLPDLSHHVFWPQANNLLPDMIDRLSYEERFSATLVGLDEIIGSLPQEWKDAPSVPLDYVSYLRQTLERFKQPKFWDELL